MKIKEFRALMKLQGVLVREVMVNGIRPLYQAYVTIPTNYYSKCCGFFCGSQNEAMRSLVRVYERKMRDEDKRI